MPARAHRDCSADIPCIRPARHWADRVYCIAARKAIPPDRAFARPVHGLVQRGEDDTFVFEELAEVAGLGQRNVFAE